MLIWQIRLGVGQVEQVQPTTPKGRIDSSGARRGCVSEGSQHPPVPLSRADECSASVSSRSRAYCWPQPSQSITYIADPMHCCHTQQQHVTSPITNLCRRFEYVTDSPRYRSRSYDRHLSTTLPPLFFFSTLTNSLDDMYCLIVRYTMSV